MKISSKYVIIPAGGIGQRMGAGKPKQLLEIGGKPILRHTIECFLNLPFQVSIILVMNKNAKQEWVDYCRKENFMFQHIFVDGGITRFHSVKNGLKYLSPESVVAVHDGVRPFISKESLITMFELAEKNEAVIPVLHPNDSMRTVLPDGNSEVVSRDNYLLVQTPQIFHSDILIESYKQPYSTLFTDDASVVEKAGYHLTMCQGSRLNIKITTPEDIALAEAIINLRASSC